MSQPIWRNVVSELRIPQPNVQWTVALPMPTAGKVMMVEVVVDTGRKPAVTGLWKPCGFNDFCTADGDFDNTVSAGAANTGVLLVASAPRGALIARIGGSTADQTIDTNIPPARVLFSIGRKCVFTVPASPAGSLYLAVNDDPSRMAHVDGQLLVNIFEAI
jgi:hypothetical protein